MSKQKTITGKDVEYFLNLKPDDITATLIRHTFAKFYDREKKQIVDRRFNTYDKITIPAGKFCGNKEKIDTHLGLLIFNKYIVEDGLYDVLGYINEEVTAGVVKGMEKKLSQALLINKITPAQMAKYMNKMQWGFTLTDCLSASLSPKTARVLPEVNKEKERLLKSNPKMFETGDPIQAAIIEKQLLDTAKKVIGNDHGMDLYNSGSNASFGNNYKSMFIMKGPIKDSSDGKYTIVTSNYSEGIKKEELQAHYDSLVSGVYPKGVGTQVGGYLTKKFLAAFQSLVLDKKWTDCGTKKTMSILITKKNMEMFKYMYIVENGKFIYLDDATIPKYVGRIVNMRFPLYCTGDKVCNRCAGELYYLEGIENVGLTSAKVTSALVQKSMKKFHDTSVHLNKINIDDIVIN